MRNAVLMRPHQHARAGARAAWGSLAAGPGARVRHPCGDAAWCGRTVTGYVEASCTIPNARTPMPNAAVSGATTTGQ